jgi:hypothetical protein
MGLVADKLNTTFTVPKGQKICFNGSGDYILIDKGNVVWSSVQYARDILPPEKYEVGPDQPNKLQPFSPDVKFK